MFLDHVLGVSFIEVFTDELLQAGIFAFISMRDLSRNRGPFFLNDLLQFFVGLGMILYHLVAKLFDRFDGSLLLGQFTQAQLQVVGMICIPGEFVVFARQLASLGVIVRSVAFRRSQAGGSCHQRNAGDGAKAVFLYWLLHF